MRRLRFHWLFLAGVALLPAVELLLPQHRHLAELLRPIFIMAILALGLNILTGFTGILNLGVAAIRSEEHTSELQSRENLVCRLLLEKKKIKYIIILMLKQTQFSVKAIQCARL